MQEKELGDEKRGKRKTYITRKSTDEEDAKKKSI